MHGGAAPQVRAAATRRLEHERMMGRIERDMERAAGGPLSPVLRAWIRAQFPADPATFRRHRRADDDSAWTPRVITLAS
jgi:hypothetical protein